MSIKWSHGRARKNYYGKIPEKWVLTSLCLFGIWKAGQTPEKRSDYYENGAVPWLVTGDLNDGKVRIVPRKITEKAVSDYKLRVNPVGTVLLAMYGATIGKTGILTLPATTNQACCACVCYPGVEPDFLLYLLQASKKRFLEIGYGGAQPNISKELIIGYVVPLPPTQVQRKIVSTMKTFDQLLQIRT